MRSKRQRHPRCHTLKDLVSDLSFFACELNAMENSSGFSLKCSACELSARHHRRIGGNDKATELFKQAEACYVRWGSPKMVQSVRGQLLLLEQTSSSEIIQTTKSRVSLVEKVKNVMKASWPVMIHISWDIDEKLKHCEMWEWCANENKTSMWTCCRYSWNS